MKEYIKLQRDRLNVILDKIFFKDKFFKRNFLNIVEKELESCNSILEIGAGKFSYLRKINKPYHITAIDANKESILEGEKNRIYNDYCIGDVRELIKEFEADRFDAVVAFDFIEHLKKNEGIDFIRNCERIAKQKVILFTPNGYLKQPPFPDNPFQEHKSGWNYYEMRSLNYKVYGINGLKCMSGMYSIPVIKPVSLGIFIRNLSSEILKLIDKEQYSFAILCVKEINT